MYDEMRGTFEPLKEFPEALIEGVHDAQLAIIGKIEAKIRSTMRPNEFESSVSPFDSLGSPGMVMYELTPRDYSLDDSGDNNPDVWDKKIEPGVDKILSAFKPELDKLGMTAQLIQSEKGWYPIRFEWAGTEDKTIDEEKVKELAQMIEKYTKPVIERRGWKWVGVYRDPEIDHGSLHLYAVVSGVTTDTLNSDDKTSMQKWKHFDNQSVVWNAMMDAELVGPSFGSSKRFGDDTLLMKGYNLRPKVVDGPIPKNLVKVL